MINLLGSTPKCVASLKKLSLTSSPVFPFGANSQSTKVEASAPATLDTQRLPLAQIKLPTRGVGLGFAISPIPNEETQALSGYDPELASMLQAMGYAVGDDEEGAEEPTEE